ncbi:MAG TPA: SIMPL domain-containing protein [Thermoanaerobaculia bacterium]|nr:SIMPL domain-containing protein [Thermoanaerobaculia bacterium]
MKRSLFILALLSCASMLAAQPAPMRETIAVSGTGRSTVTPDRVTFNVSVQTVGQTVDEAVNENNAKVAAVVAALKKGGARDADIRTSNFSIYPQQDYQQGKLPRILGYNVSNSITVSRTNPADASKLLQAAINAGVNQSSGLGFEVSDPTRGRDAGLKAAFDDAKSKATLLAQAAGRVLGPAISISEGSGVVSPPPPRPYVAMARAEAVSEVPVEAGSQENQYMVSVVFELR